MKALEARVGLVFRGRWFAVDAKELGERQRYRPRSQAHRGAEIALEIEAIGTAMSGHIVWVQRLVKFHY